MHTITGCLWFEIPIQVTVQMEDSFKNKDTISKYNTFITQCDKGPVDSEYENITNNIFKTSADNLEDSELEDELLLFMVLEMKLRNMTKKNNMTNLAKNKKTNKSL